MAGKRKAPAPRRARKAPKPSSLVVDVTPKNLGSGLLGRSARAIATRNRRLKDI